ncbi:DUF2730 domain-containing protein [Pasteurella multocida]|uniref:DUF2730 family protein n=1 Tax=Pasteurella multocida TaxID=747 RepID=UPI00147F6C59|nr:DUF2730 family protein [Pasteurella multocida]NNH97849.1 DUF2730 domain-containing protein [Pasteurella multocida]
MNDILDFIQKHWAIVMAIGGSVWTYFWLTMDSKYARKSDISDLRKAIAENEKNLSEIKGELRHLPTTADVADLRLSISEMKGETKALNATVRSLIHQVELLVEKEVTKE